MTQAPATPELVERLKAAAIDGWSYDVRLLELEIAAAVAAAHYADALEAQQARIAELEAERDDWFGEWAAASSARIHDNEAASAKLEASQALADRYEKALTEVRDLEPVPFEGGLDWAAIGACEDCQNYKDHPLMRGICNAHRRPLYDRESHDIREEKRLGWRAKCIAREALSSQGRHEGGETGSIPELPGVNAVPLPASPDGLQAADEHRYAKLGRACEAHGLGWFDEDGEMRFQPPADMIAEQARREAREVE